jgi:hypothetical protein
MWMRLTDTKGNPVVVNSDNVVWFQPDGDRTEIHVTYYGGDRNITIVVKETLEHVTSMVMAE